VRVVPELIGQATWIETGDADPDVADNADVPAGGRPMMEVPKHLAFTSEDDLDEFERWLRYQKVNPANSDEKAMWRAYFDEARVEKFATRKVGLMKLPPLRAGEYRYAVAVRDETGRLWLTLWVRRDPKGDYFVMLPRKDRRWHPHVSYHRDGRLHSKSHGRKLLSAQKRQRLDAAFRGSENLGAFAGHGPKNIGAICDPSAFSGVLEVPVGVLGPRDGTVIVDLVEPVREPEVPWRNVVLHYTFRDALPWVAIRVAKCD